MLMWLAWVVHALAQPLAWVLLLLICALVVGGRRPRLARWLSVVATLTLAIMGWKPLADVAMRSLEGAYAAPQGDLSGFAGVVVLGGVLADDDARTQDQFQLNEAAERIVEAVRLLRRYPHLRLVFTGGDVPPRPGERVEADRARSLFESLGIGPERAQYERDSTTTWENAMYGARLLGPDIQRPWLLVTSASHMRRSMAAFKKAGWNVTAFPVDYRSDSTTGWFEYSLNRGAEEWRTWLREVIGYRVYQLLGRA